VTVAKPVELLGVHCKDMQATFHQQLDAGTPRYCDGDCDTMHLPCGQVCKPGGALSQSNSLMLDAPFTGGVSKVEIDGNTIL